MAQLAALSVKQSGRPAPVKKNSVTRGALVAGLESLRNDYEDAVKDMERMRYFNPLGHPSMLQALRSANCVPAETNGKLH